MTEGWQPIETAPKDENLLLFIEGGFMVIGNRIKYEGYTHLFQEKDYHCSLGDLKYALSEQEQFFNWVLNPTHWTNLPDRSYFIGTKWQTMDSVPTETDVLVDHSVGIDIGWATYPTDKDRSYLFHSNKMNPDYEYIPILRPQYWISLPQPPKGLSDD